MHCTVYHWSCFWLLTLLLLVISGLANNINSAYAPYICPPISWQCVNITVALLKFYSTVIAQYFLKWLYCTKGFGLPECLWSVTKRRTSPGSPLMLKHTASLLSGKSTTKWGSPSATEDSDTNLVKYDKTWKKLFFLFIFYIFNNIISFLLNISPKQDAFTNLRLIRTA